MKHSFLLWISAHHVELAYHQIALCIHLRVKGAEIGATADDGKVSREGIAPRVSGLTAVADGFQFDDGRVRTIMEMLVLLLHELDDAVNHRAWLGRHFLREMEGAEIVAVLEVRKPEFCQLRREQLTRVVNGLVVFVRFAKHLKILRAGGEIGGAILANADVGLRLNLLISLKRFTAELVPDATAHARRNHLPKIADGGHAWAFVPFSQQYFFPLFKGPIGVESPKDTTAYNNQVVVHLKENFEGIAVLDFAKK